MSALAQAKEEQERRIHAERELTEYKAKVSKEVSQWHDALVYRIARIDTDIKALLHSSVSETWPDVATALPKLEELCAPFALPPLDERREASNPRSNRQTPLSSAPETFSTGLATPQSRVGTVDIEPAPSERATSEVVDLTASGTEADPVRAGSLKRPASPSSLDDEQSALKRRRMQELRVGALRPSVERADTPEHQALTPLHPPPESRSPSPSPVHEFGPAPLLMGSPAVEPGEIISPRVADPDQTLVDVPPDDARREEGELTPVEVKPYVKPPVAHVVSQRNTQPPTLKEEEEEGEIKQEVQASPQLVPALSPVLPVRPLPQPTPGTRTTPDPLPSLPRKPSAGTCSAQPAPASRSPVVTHTLPPKPAVPAPSPSRPPVKRTLTISHINLAYNQVGKRYTCVMCKYVSSVCVTCRRSVANSVLSLGADMTWIPRSVWHRSRMIRPGTLLPATFRLSIRVVTSDW